MTAQTLPSDSTSAIPKRFPDLGIRVKEFFLHAIAQVRILEKVYPGVMHAFIFWGVTIQILGTAINLMQMKLFTPFVLDFPRSSLYLSYELIMDLAGAAILVGVIMATFRRAVLKPKALITKWDDTYTLILLALIPLAGFTTESFRLVATSPSWAAWSPIGNLYANFWRSLYITPEIAAVIHPYMVVIHVVLGLIFVASIPFTKLRHLIFVPTNIVTRPQRKEGSIEKIENIDEADTLGVGQVNEFKSSQLLSLEACVQCGRCEEVCPATISGMPYSPRKLIYDLHQIMVSGLIPQNGKTAPEIFGEAIAEDTPWYCTTCGACIKKCPTFVNPVDEVVDLRRYQVLTTGSVQKYVGDVLRNVERQGNPWGMPADDRTTWTEGLGVRKIAPGEETDVLFYVGCAAAYDDRNKKVAQSFLRLLQKTGVDYAILGLDEACCGETARRMGNEYLFQVMAGQNIETFNKIKFKRIITQCPHCFNTLKNEYPQMGGNYVVQHYTEFLAEHSLPWEKGKPNGNSLNGRLAYHDSCYLGRYNNIYTQPRQLLEKVGINRVELPRFAKNSFCCGGGGGQMWMETDAETRINRHRLQDALDAKVDVVATACPYCLIMFDDAIRSKGLGEQMKVLDIAEVIERQLP